MKAWTDEGTIRAAELAIDGIRIYNLRPDGTRAFRFTLKTDGPEYRRTGRAGRTIPGAVSWEGHRDFMRALFAADPNARLQTALADYHGREEFIRDHPDTRSVYDYVDGASRAGATGH